MKHLMLLFFVSVVPLLASATIPEEDKEFIWVETSGASSFKALARIDQRRLKMGERVYVEVAIVLMNRSSEVLHYRIDYERLICDGRFDPAKLAGLGVRTLFNSVASSVGALLPEKGLNRSQDIVGSYRYDRRGIIGPVSDEINDCEISVRIILEPVSGSDFRLESEHSESVSLQSPVLASG